MSTVDSLSLAFRGDNLRRAWLWTRTNSEALFKQYFRHIYRAYSLAADLNLDDLRGRLESGTYQPTHATKLYFPKKSGILRPYSLLCIEDQVVYQALVNVVADRLYPRVRSRYYTSVFGHLYAGRRSRFFYRRWRDGYSKFSDALCSSYEKGFVYSASFDLTACYDSIDHGVLKHFLGDLGLEPEFQKRLCDFLRHWTASSSHKPIYQEHGIPQGPLPSGLLSECVLRHFDGPKLDPKKVRYFRYVDDIRLLAKSEEELRRKLVDLDMLSKDIGLFPQSSKIHIHRITNIDEEIKSISNPPEIVTRRPGRDQSLVRARLKDLTRRYEVANETRFKYVLGAALPNAELSKRLLTIVDRQPHLYISIFNYLSKASTLPKSVAAQCLKLLRQKNLYPAFSAALLRAMTGRIKGRQRGQLLTLCSQMSKDRNQELVAASAAILLLEGALGWKQTKEMLSSHEWWVRSILIGSVRKDLIGDPSYESLVNLLLRDPMIDVALVAADLAISEECTIPAPRNNIHRSAQITLKAAGLIGRIMGGTCYISDSMVNILGPRVMNIDWKKVMGSDYKRMLRRVVRWRGYIESDATSWVNITDTINDALLEKLFLHDSSIGAYQLGNLGGVLNPTGKFAKGYPLLFDAVKRIHGKRLESDLSHPVTKSTGKPTGAIRFRALQPLKRALARGCAEMWKKW